MIYQFENCHLDTDRIVLHRDGEVVAIEPQVFDLLHCLVRHRGSMIRKEELLDEVWGDRFVSESALTSRVKSARRAVGDDGTSQRIIRTIHGKGYEFVAEVVESDEPPPSPSPSGDPSPASTSLPVALQGLIGRDELLDRLAAELADDRLLTIVGPAGVGKTSLGLELARRVSSRHRDGVYLIELVTVGDGDAALASLATTLDVSVQQHSSLDAAVVDMLRPRQVLLILDNCEHLIEPVATLVDRILRAAPGVTIVATSREPLAVPGEQVHVLEPLDVAGLDAMPLDELAAVPAVALFVERASAVDDRFELNTATAPAVAEICRRLDGIPLALELAAARTAAIDVDELARRLDARLRLLKGVRRGADPRHGTLVDAISWSYDLLDPDEQRLFAQLAVFAGTFDLSAAESICGEDDDVLDLLTRLSQRSMIAVRRPPSGGIRYEMLETLREFGQTRLDDLGNAALFTSHAHHFADLAESVEAGLRTPTELVAVHKVDGSFADLRAAQRFAVQVGDVDTALRLITSIREYAMRGLRYEVFAWADAAAAELGDEVHPLRPTLTALRGYGAFVRGEFETALALANAASADTAAQGITPTGLAERVRANTRYSTGDTGGGIAENAALVEIANATGVPSLQVHANYMASVAYGSVGDYDEARVRYEAAFEAARRSGAPTDLASAYTATGFATAHDDDAALDAFANADRLARSAGNRWMSAFAQTEASSLRLIRGDLEPACAGLAETVDTWYRAGEWAQQWVTLSRCVVALDRIGRTELAAEVCGAIEHHTVIDAPPVTPTVRDAAVATRASLPEQLGDERAGELLAIGARLPLTTVVHRTRAALLGLPDD